MGYMNITIDDLRVDCLIGVWSHERNRAQQLRVDLTVDFETRNAAQSDRLNHTLNYADVARDVAFILEEGRFHLLESAVWMLQQWILLPPTQVDNAPLVQRVEVRLTKFGALPGSALASVRGSQVREAVTYACERKEWGTVDVVGETSRVGVYRLNIAPGATLPIHYHAKMREAELILSDGLVGLNTETSEPLTAGHRTVWSHGRLHGYRNNGEKVASVLCIDAPPFIPADEKLASS